MITILKADLTPPKKGQGNPRITNWTVYVRGGDGRKCTSVKERRQKRPLKSYWNHLPFVIIYAPPWLICHLF